MTIAQTSTTSFKVELLQAVHNFGPTTPNTFKLALYTATAEVVGTGYVAGGNTLVISTSPTSGNNGQNVPTAYVSFADSAWTNASFTARGALVYNSTQGNKTVAVLDFGADKTVVGQTFTVVFPTASATAAIVRIS